MSIDISSPDNLDTVGRTFDVYGVKNDPLAVLAISAKIETQGGTFLANGAPKSPPGGYHWAFEFTDVQVSGASTPHKVVVTAVEGGVSKPIAVNVYVS